MADQDMMLRELVAQQVMKAKNSAVQMKTNVTTAQPMANKKQKQFGRAALSVGGQNDDQWLDGGLEEFARQQIMKAKNLAATSTSTSSDVQDQFNDQSNDSERHDEYEDEEGMDDEDDYLDDEEQSDIPFTRTNVANHHKASHQYQSLMSHGSSGRGTHLGIPAQHSRSQRGVGRGPRARGGKGNAIPYTNNIHSLSPNMPQHLQPNLGSVPRSFALHQQRFPAAYQANSPNQQRFPTAHQSNSPNIRRTSADYNGIELHRTNSPSSSFNSPVSTRPQLSSNRAQKCNSKQTASSKLTERQNLSAADLRKQSSAELSSRTDETVVNDSESQHRLSSTSNDTRINFLDNEEELQAFVNQQLAKVRCVPLVGANNTQTSDPIAKPINCSKNEATTFGSVKENSRAKHGISIPPLDRNTHTGSDSKASPSFSNNQSLQSTKNVAVDSVVGTAANAVIHAVKQSVKMNDVLQNSVVSAPANDMASASYSRVGEKETDVCAQLSSQQQGKKQYDSEGPDEMKSDKSIVNANSTLADVDSLDKEEVHKVNNREHIREDGEEIEDVEEDEEYDDEDEEEWEEDVQLEDDEAAEDGEYNDEGEEEEEQEGYEEEEDAEEGDDRVLMSDESVLSGVKGKENVKDKETDAQSLDQSVELAGNADAEVQDQAITPKTTTHISEGPAGVTKVRKARAKKKVATAAGTTEEQNEETKQGDKPKRKRKKKGDSEEKQKKTKKAKTMKGVRRTSFERKNIREIIDEKNLEEETKAAQKVEMERKQRLLDIQEKLRLQALELRAQREQEILTTGISPSFDHVPDMFGNSHPIFSALQDGIGDIMPTNDKLDSESYQSRTSLSARPKPADIVEISSSEDDNDDDDDDVIMMPSDSEDIDDGTEDTENSGSHVNDAMNQPNADGSVLVNVGHPLSEPDILLAPQLAGAVKPHQIGGIRFLYDNLVESLDRFRTTNGLGCILAHSMGLGKTIQAIAFIDIFLRHTDARSALIIVPVNTLMNWVNEFNMWLPLVSEMDCDVDKEILQPREFQLYVINDNQKTNEARTKVVSDWYRTGGVLLLGYEMYRLLTTKKVLIKPRRTGKRAAAAAAAAGPVVIDLEEDESNQELLKSLHEALMRPGPDLVVCDEGHRIKNSHASTSQALKNIRTRRRVVLTGYPLQNNLIEYWCMVDFVRPNYLGTRTEFANMFERPITNGQCADSTANDAKLMRFRAHVLHSLLEGFVQRRGHVVLQKALPQKEEYVLFVRMSPIQRSLYREFMNSLKDDSMSWASSNNPIKAFSVCCKIWNHPDILYQMVEQRREDTDLDIDDPALGPAVMENNIIGRTNRRGRGRPSKHAGVLGASASWCGSASDDRCFANTTEKRDSRMISYDWAKDLLKDYIPGIAEYSGKLLILMDLIDGSVRIGNKILVFSQSLFTLNLIEDYLSNRKIPGTEDYWERNRSYFRLDGSTAGMDREKLINRFNDVNNDKIHLFLLSTRAGCLGINLIGASRVVVFDASWNPCHDCQAVCRVYRYGQTKCCYVYRLVTDNTMEKTIYDRQINKQGMSDRVVDELNPQNFMTRNQVDKLLRFVDVDMPVIDPSGCESRCRDELLVNVVKTHHKWITKEPFTHESLLLDRKDQKLTRQEKRQAKQGYEMEKRMSGVGLSGGGGYLHRSSYSSDNLYSSSRDELRRYAMGSGDRPVASVRPIMSNPMQLQGDSLNNYNSRLLRHAPGLKPGVSVQQIQTTRDIIIPDSDSSGENRIPAGEKVLVIKTPKGVYMRTSQGKIFAIRTAPKGDTTASQIGEVSSQRSSDQFDSQHLQSSVPSRRPEASETLTSSAAGSESAILPLLHSSSNRDMFAATKDAFGMTVGEAVANRLSNASQEKQPSTIRQFASLPALNIPELINDRTGEWKQQSSLEQLLARRNNFLADRGSPSNSSVTSLHPSMLSTSQNRSLTRVPGTSQQHVDIDFLSMSSDRGEGIENSGHANHSVNDAHDINDFFNSESNGNVDDFYNDFVVPSSSRNALNNDIGLLQNFVSDRFEIESENRALRRPKLNDYSDIMPSYKANQYLQSADMVMPPMRTTSFTRESDLNSRFRGQRRDSGAFNDSISGVEGLFDDQTSSGIRRQQNSLDDVSLDSLLREGHLRSSSASDTYGVKRNIKEGTNGRSFDRGDGQHSRYDADLFSNFDSASYDQYDMDLLPPGGYFPPPAHLSASASAGDTSTRHTSMQYSLPQNSHRGRLPDYDNASSGMVSPYDEALTEFTNKDIINDR